MFGDRRGRRVGFLLLLAAVCLLGTSCASGRGKETPPQPQLSEAQRQQAELLNQSAEELYQKALQGDVSGSRTSLIQISDLTTGLTFEGLTTVEGMNALTQTITEAKKVFQAVRYQPAEGQVSAAKLRLAADALIHKNQPLWLQHYKTLQEDVNALEKSAAEGSREALRQSAADLREHIGLLHPSLLISRDGADVAKLDSLVSFVGTQTDGSAEHFRNVQNAAAPLRQTIDKLFMKKEATAYLPYPEPPHPILWTTAFGSVILAALAFAGWRLSKKDGGLTTVRRGGEETF